MTVDGSNDNFACRWSHGWFGAPKSLGARAAANQTREHRERDRGFNLRWKLARWLKEVQMMKALAGPERTNMVSSVLRTIYLKKTNERR